MAGPNPESSSEPPAPRTQEGRPLNDASLFDKDAAAGKTQVDVPKYGSQTSKFAWMPQQWSDVTVNTASLSGVLAASDKNSATWNQQVAAADTNLSWDDLSAEDQDTITDLAKARGGRSGSALWERAVALSERSVRDGDPRTPYYFLNTMMGKVGDSGSSGGSGGSRGYSGPVSSTTFMDERDVDRTANALALELIGRPLSDKELAKVTKRLRSEESANPTVTTPGVGSSVTDSGLSAEGRSDVLREVISENPDFQQFQVDHTVLDSMLASLSKREKMVNG